MSSPVVTAEKTLVAAEHGDLRDLPSAMENLGPDGSPEARAVLFALTAVRLSLDPVFRAVPVPSDTKALIGAPAPARLIAARACGRMVRLAALAFDRDGVDAWAKAQRALGTGETTEIGQRLSGGWAAILSGERSGMRAELDRALEDAAATGDAAGTVEATVLRALLEDDEGDLVAAIETARRAARMAQTESRPEDEYLAHLVLARLRRRAGRPHLAVHILTDLARHAPAPWHPWIAWELVIAGAVAKAEALLAALAADRPRSAPPPAAGLVRAACDLLRAARVGNRKEFSRAEEALADAPPWTALRGEIQGMLALIDRTHVTVPGPVHDWSRGAEGGVPLGLDGLGIPPGAATAVDDAVGLVFAEPGQPGRRILRSGSGVLPAARNLEGADEDTGGARTETGLAVLALTAPNPLSRADFFRAVYGFGFAHDRHRGVLDVLVHRMRTRLDDAGTIDRDAKEGTLALVLKHAVVVPDGRCTLAPAERVLRALADLGTTGTQQAADRLNVPLRSLQRTLQELVAEGSCEALRDGGRVVYRIRDTTFTTVTSLDASRLH